MMSGEDRDDEKRTFLSLLPGTLDALCSLRTAPHDDTILHRLVDIIKQLVSSPADAQSAGVFCFLNTVKDKLRELSSPVVVLGLEVAAHLLAMEMLHTEEWGKVAVMFDITQSSLATEDSSVGAAYFSSLVSVAGCTRGLQWLEKTNIHVHTALSTLETAQSVFLRKAAENFVLNMLKKILESSSTNAKQSCLSSGVVIDTAQFLVNELAEIGQGRATLLDQLIVSSHASGFHQSVVQLVASLCQCDKFCEWKAEDDKLLTILARLALQHSSEKIRLCALQSVVRLVGFMKGERREEFLRKEVLSPVLKVVSEGGIETGVAVAAAFVISSQGAATSEALSTLQGLHQLPHDLLFGQHIQHPQLTGLTSSVIASLGDQHKFSRLVGSVMHSLKQTCNSEGLVRLMQAASSSRSDEDWSSLLSSWPQGMGAVVMGNQRLLNSLLHMLQKEDCPGLCTQQCTSILKNLTHIMRRPMVESRLYSQACAAFLNTLRRQYQLIDTEDVDKIQEVLSCLVTLWANRLVTLQWEIRDSTLEMIGNVISIVSDAWFCKMLLEHQLLLLAWKCTKDRESYPRASAISLVTHLVNQPDWWAALLKDSNITEESLVNEITEVLVNDTEAFPRRAAVVFLTAFCSHYPLSHWAQTPPSVSSGNSKQRSQICSALTSAMNDFDWEVKVKVLEFWEMMAAPVLSAGQSRSDSYNQTDSQDNRLCRNGAMEANSSALHREKTASLKRKCEKTDEVGHQHILENLLQDGFGKALLVGAEDYDSAVKQKALGMLAVLQDTVQLEGLVPVKACKVDNIPQESIATDACCDHGDDQNAVSGGVSTPSLSDELTVDQFMQRVKLLDPTRQLQEMGKSADEYDRKPTSVLEDVMAAAKMASAATTELGFMSEDEFDDADDMFVDCY